MTPFRHSLEFPLGEEREKCDKTASFIRQFTLENRNELTQIVHYAHLIQKGIDTLSPLIQEITSAVCPACEEVCCRNRHGYYDHEDLVYIYSLGLKPPVYCDGIKDSDLCQFLSAQGCSRERSVRPFRCTWYFCSPLIQYMENGPARPSRELRRRLQEVIDLRREMLEEFSRIAGLLNR